MDLLLNLFLITCMVMLQIKDRLIIHLLVVCILMDIPGMEQWQELTAVHGKIGSL